MRGPPQHASAAANDCLPCTLVQGNPGPALTFGMSMITQLDGQLFPLKWTICSDRTS